MKVILLGLLSLPLLCGAATVDQEPLLPHRDELLFDERLTLGQVVESAFEKYPKSALVTAYQEEASALERRSSSWIAGYPMLFLQYIDDFIFGQKAGMTEIQTGYQVPLWMWGQKAASEKVTEEARKSAEKYGLAIKHELAGLVRDSLWNLRVMDNRLELAHRIHDVAIKLVRVVERRVELGDLAKADLLLAESDQLTKKTTLVQAETDVQHARNAYHNLTRMLRAPKQFEETLPARKTLDENHPAMAAANASVERAQAEVDLTQLSKEGNQPTLLFGSNSTEINDQGRMGTGSNIVIQVPIGGDDWHAPKVAEANILLNEKIAQRETLWRQLERALLESQRTLDVDKAALVIAERRKTIAETQLDMSKIAFEAGEIALIDYLKIQASAQSAIRDAAERAILVQKDIAVLNQVMGITP